MMKTRFKRPLGILAALALALLPAASIAQQRGVPVIAGQDPGYDACGTQGVVRGLDPQGGDGFLAVRAGPGSGYAMLDKVYNGYILNICDTRGQWLGVVYSHETMDCGVGTPWPRARAYNGPCSSGWVFRKYVSDVAG
jgi:SH3 domain-containing protein